MAGPITECRGIGSADSQNNQNQECQRLVLLDVLSAILCLPTDGGQGGCLQDLLLCSQLFGDGNHLGDYDVFNQKI